MCVFILWEQCHVPVLRDRAYNFGAHVPDEVMPALVMPAVHTQPAPSQELFEPPAAPDFRPHDRAEDPAPDMQAKVLQLAIPEAMPATAAPAVTTTTTMMTMTRRIWMPNWMHDPLAQ